MNRRQMIRAAGAGAAAPAWAGARADASDEGLEAWKSVRAARGQRDGLRRLPTTVRPVVDPADVVVPDGYEIEPLIVGLSFPTCMEFGDDGSLFIGEGGSTWPTRGPRCRRGS